MFCRPPCLIYFPSSLWPTLFSDIVFAAAQFGGRHSAAFIYSRHPPMMLGCLLSLSYRCVPSSPAVFALPLCVFRFLYSFFGAARFESVGRSPRSLWPRRGRRVLPLRGARTAHPVSLKSARIVPNCGRLGSQCRRGLRGWSARSVDTSGPGLPFWFPLLPPSLVTCTKFVHTPPRGFQFATPCFRPNLFSLYTNISLDIFSTLYYNHSVHN